MANETEYCGSCEREQTGGEKCKSCGKKTVTWYKDRETAAQVKAKWKRIVRK